MNPKLSVGIPVYNEAKYLAQTLESLRQQSIADAEFIIADNASTDDSLQIARSFAAADGRFQVFAHPSNLGATDNFAFLLSRARGSYLMFLGAHDLLTARYLERAVAVLEVDPGVSMVSGHPEAMTESGERQGLVPQAIYDFSDELPLARYLKSVAQLFDCTCFHSVSRRAAWQGLEFRKTISADHVWISRLIWQGKLHYVTEERFIRRNFDTREVSIEARITGGGTRLPRHDFYSYYLDDFDKLYHGHPAQRIYIQMKILGILESRFGSAGLLPNDGLLT